MGRQVTATPNPGDKGTVPLNKIKPERMLLKTRAAIHTAPLRASALCSKPGSRALHTVHSGAQVCSCVCAAHGQAHSLAWRPEKYAGRSALTLSASLPESLQPWPVLLEPWPVLPPRASLSLTGSSSEHSPPVDSASPLTSCASYARA